jgi:hypothetical protein
MSTPLKMGNRASQKFFSAACGSKFFWMFGEKAGCARFFTKHPQKIGEQPKAARSPG